MILIGGICTLSLAMGLSRFGFTPVIPLMQRDTGISEWHIAVLASANYTGYLIGAYTSRQPGIRQHTQTWLGIGLVLSILLLAAMPLTMNAVLWSVLRLLSGFLSAILFVVASSITLGQGRTAWAGYLYSGVGIGIMLTGLLVPLFDTIGGWQAAWLGLAVCGSLLGAVAWHTLAEKRAEPVPAVPAGTQGRFVRDRQWVALLISYSLEGIGYIITATFIVQMIKAMPELSHIANQSWAVIGCAAIPSAYVWAQIARKTGIKQSLILAFALQAAGILIPVISQNQVSILVGAILFGGTFMGITSLTITLAHQLKPESSLQAIGELTTIYAVGQILGPIAAAYLQKHVHSLAPSLFAVGVLLLALLAVTALTTHQKGGNV